MVKAIRVINRVVDYFALSYAQLLHTLNPAVFLNPVKNSAYYIDPVRNDNQIIRS